MFDWYATDFGSADNAIIACLNRYAEVRIAPSTKLVFLPYDWSLNERPTPALPAPVAERK